LPLGLSAFREWVSTTGGDLSGDVVAVFRTVGERPRVWKTRIIVTQQIL